MLPRRVFHVKPGLCPTLKSAQDYKVSRRHRRSTSLDFYHDNYNNMGRRSSSISCLEMRENLVIPEPTRASRPIDINQLFPEREKLDVSGVELVKPSENPIIVITEDPDNQYDGDEDDSDIINEDSDAESLDTETPDCKENIESTGTTTKEVSENEKSINTEKLETHKINENANEKNNEEKTGDIENIQTNENPVISKGEQSEIEEVAIENENTENSSEITNDIANQVEPVENQTPEMSDESNDLVESTKETKKDTDIPSESTEVEIQESNITVGKEVSNVQENPKIDQELINELVNLQRGWFDSNIRKQIKPTPKGWQLIHV